MVDAVFVGSGINSMVGGALLAQAGWRVCILERNPWLGGAIHTTELTVPGFRHEVFSSWHPLFTSSGAYAELGEELGRRGVEYLNTDLPTATLFPDGEAAFLTTDLDANVATAHGRREWRAMFDELMANADFAFGVLSDRAVVGRGPRLAAKAYRRLGRRGLVEFSGTVLANARDWLGATFPSERTHGLLAPWVLHTGLGPDAASSGFMCQVIAGALQLGGMPVPRGGGSVLVDALAGIIVRRRRRDADRRGGGRGARRRRRGARRPARSATRCSPAARSSATSRRTSSTAGSSRSVPSRRLRPRPGGDTASGAQACRSTTRCPSGPTGRGTSA